ncbi:MAG TPA: FAD-dependent oxidoreductase [Methanomassiliicoccales archaeon]|nr:FAD-dependent oxidoreductase [Methanomassiliicoccales archaeon]
MARKIIVIGTGAAGMPAASAARRTDKDAEINVFTDDEYIAYSPCVIPWVLEGLIDWDYMVMHNSEFYKKERNINVHTKTKVTDVDADNKKITTEDGKEWAYDSLIIATGGYVWVPPIGGKDLDGVFTVRTINDGKRIQASMKGAKSAVIAGAGVIGLEMALAMKKTGLDVTVIEMFPQVIPRIFDKDMADMVQEYLEGEGIKFVMGTPIGSIKGENGKAVSVIAGDKEYPAEVIIMATGVRANLEIPNKIGLDIGELGAIRVSPTMQPYKKGRLVPDIYLAGDVIQVESCIVPGPTMSQLGSSAVRQGIVAGTNSAGGSLIYPGVTSPWVSVIGDIQCGGTGISLGLASYYGINVVEGKYTGLSCARYYPGHEPVTVKILVEKGSHKVLGAQMVGKDPQMNGRVNWITGALEKGVTIEEFVIQFENAYCPPTSMVRDPAHTAAEVAMNKL